MDGNLLLPFLLDKTLSMCMSKPKILPHYDFFVSGRWRNRDNVLDLTKRIREKGYSVYCFLEASHSIARVNDDPEKSMQTFEKLDWRNDPYVKEVFENDMLGEKIAILLSCCFLWENHVISKQE